eukprot:Skav231226  [mRNA]  locus=scaffold813:207057:207530:+ [translate_table: standard]
MLVGACRADLSCSNPEVERFSSEELQCRQPAAANRRGRPKPGQRFKPFVSRVDQSYINLPFRFQSSEAIKNIYFQLSIGDLDFSVSSREGPPSAHVKQIDRSVAHPDRLFEPGKCSASAEFFSSEEAATKMREQIADECMHEDRFLQAEIDVVGVYG